MNLDTNKTFKWRCLHHNCDLDPSGHSAGLGGECWPGVSFDYDKKEWSIDSSELSCPLLEDEATVEQMDACCDSWEIVQ